MTNDQFFRDRSGYLWELVEGARFEEGAYVKCVDGPPGAYPDGVQRLMHYDPNGPVQIGIANERPAREFYVRRRDEAQTAKMAAESDRVAAQAEVDRINAVETAATTVAAVKALNAPENDPDDQTPYEKRSAARAAVAGLDAAVTGIDAAIADGDDRIAAVDSLGRDFVPIPEIEAEVERMRAAR